MDNNLNNTFPEVLPEHPHRRLYILIFLLVFVVVGGYIIVSQIRGSNQATIINKPDTNSEDQKIAEFNNRLTNISESLKESDSGQTTLTPDELKKIAENMNKSKKK